MMTTMRAPKAHDPFAPQPLGARPSFAAYWPDTRFVELRSDEGYFARLLGRTPTDDDEHLLMLGGSVVHHERVHWQIAHGLTWGMMRSALVSLRTTLASLFFRNLPPAALHAELARHVAGRAVIATGSDVGLDVPDRWSATSQTLAEHAWLLTMLPAAIDHGGMIPARPMDFALGIAAQYLGGAFDPISVALGDNDAAFQARVRSFRTPDPDAEWRKATTGAPTAMAVEECLAVSAQLVFLDRIETTDEDERRVIAAFAKDIYEGVFGAGGGHYPVCFDMACRHAGLAPHELDLRGLGLLCELALDPPLPFHLGGDAADWSWCRLHPGARFRALLAAVDARALISGSAHGHRDMAEFAAGILARAGLRRASGEDVRGWLETHDEDATEWASQELGWQHVQTALRGRAEVEQRPGVLHDFLPDAGGDAPNPFYDLPFVLLDGETQLEDPDSEAAARSAGQQVLAAHVARMTDHFAFRVGPLEPLGLPTDPADPFFLFAQRAHEIFASAWGVDVPPILLP